MTDLKIEIGMYIYFHEFFAYLNVIHTKQNFVENARFFPAEEKKVVSKLVNPKAVEIRTHIFFFLLFTPSLDVLSNLYSFDQRQKAVPRRPPTRL